MDVQTAGDRMTPLQKILDSYRQAAVTEREKGTYFEELIICYLKNEASYKDLYSDVWTYAEWAKAKGLDGKDTGIDLVAKTAGTGEYHAIQCKFYAPDHHLQKKDIDSFFTASGTKDFTHRIIVSSTNHWSENAEKALFNQQIPVSKIDLFDLENSQIDWSRYQPDQTPVFHAKKGLRPHQVQAKEAVIQGLAAADRGKLIMACGTGKTFTSLKIAEAIAGKGKRVLFLVPSLNLLSQTLTEWTQESAVPLHSYAVCSDSDVGKSRKKDSDTVQTYAHELRYPATTSPEHLAQEMAKRHDAQHMSVVFATYQSIDVLHRAQQAHSLPAFDLIICDEAHRTTGAKFAGEDESAFIRVHNNDYLHAAKRLYMTATPRVYGTSAKATAERDNIVLCSMDDETLYGRELFVINFSEAVRQDLLVDYKVIVLAVDEATVSRKLQTLLKDSNNSLRVDDATKIVGCWKALSKQGLVEDLADDFRPMQRAVAFCQVIEEKAGAKVHKISSKHIAGIFQEVVETYQAVEKAEHQADKEPLSERDAIALNLVCSAEHVDGSMNATAKEEKLAWLKKEPPANTCHILSNVRCLSEGVDVPALDAVLFLTPRNSQVDVVQSVGRVMRKAPGKKRGYIILPVVIPAGIEPEKALDDNKTYAVVWQVLQALRSHDDRFDAMVNRLELNGAEPDKMEVIAISDRIGRKTRKTPVKPGRKKDFLNGGSGSSSAKPEQTTFDFEVGEIERAIYAKLVKKVGNRHHWEDWAKDVAKIAQTHIDRIKGILENPDNVQERQVFDALAEELRDDLNNSITDDEIIEMLAQHLITKPVFDALFEKYQFAASNPMSIALQKAVDVLEQHHLEKETTTLKAFYDSVRMRASGIEKAEGKQKIVKELYETFFQKAFPVTAQKMGTVYTPIEVIDFIIHSVASVLENEFKQTLGSPGVHILDPFTGTGTFITRLLQSGLIAPEELAYKYKKEIHANEIILLAYYIAAINIETTYHELVGGDYQPFEGICLTDTFQLYEKEDLVDEILVQNSARRKRQKTLDIRVIIGNPPYSVGQKEESEETKRVGYPYLDNRIRESYVKKSSATLSKGTYDSYIRAIRWASDRIGESGVIGFVTNAGWLEASSADGMRKCLVEEFSSLYIFHLRGNARTKGERRRKEKGNVFGEGTRAPVAVSILVKNPVAQKKGQIYFHDIGDYLTREEKLQKVADFASIDGITQTNGWRLLIPDDYGDWLNQRDTNFGSYPVLGNKKDKTGTVLFENFSMGIVTARDIWCYNASRRTLTTNMSRMIRFYNQQRNKFQHRYGSLERKARDAQVDDFIDTNPAKISWSHSLKEDVSKDKPAKYHGQHIVPSLYRPFMKAYLYYDRQFNERVYQMPQIFPDDNVKNRVICVTGIGASSGFSVLMADKVPNLHTLDTSQCFPLYLYEANETDAPLFETGQTPQSELFGDSPEQGLFDKQTTVSYTRRDAITDDGLAYFQKAYPDENITKEDIFYYVYGLLHSEDYRERYADNLMKELPRIPCVKSAADFWAFSKAGRQLANLHLNYESVKPYPLEIEGVDLWTDKDRYRVEKMRYGKQGKEKDLTTIIYNDYIVVKGIPLEAYDYVVNGKSAIDWVVERQSVTTDKDSQIVNDANDWANETMHNPCYPLELLQRVVTVSLETMKIVRALPRLDILI